MNNKLFVAGIPFAYSEDELRELFSQYGTVQSATIIKDRDTGRSKGFGFVEMSSADEANAAIKGLHDSTVMDRKIVVNIAKPREDRGSDGGGFRRNDNNRFNGGGGGGHGYGRDRDSRRGGSKRY